MEATCQRCHEPVRDEQRYCPTCGLPQLTYVAAETPVIQIGDERAVPGHEEVVLGGIAWRPALRAALLLAIPAGLVSATLTPMLSIIWVMGAGAWAVVIYARWVRRGAVSVGSGARIGLVTGLLASWLMIGVNGLGLWLGRFVLHQGGQMDSLWLAQVESTMQFDRQMVTQMGIAGAQAAQSIAASRAMMLSAEGRAGIELFTSLAGAAILTIFAIIGGAVGARFLVQPRRPSA